MTEAEHEEARAAQEEAEEARAAQEEGGRVACEKAVIFDIQRYSVHDGPGIRTVVFFKGCSLRCKWCQNPESLRRSPDLGFLSERCISCKNCEKACPEGAILSGAKRIDRLLCTVCGECIETCYSEALRMIGVEVGEEELMEEVLRDRPFYEDSGGGVTLSGGEPLLQIDFVEEFCSRCRREGISVVVETCGQVPSESFTRVLPLVDLFLYDVKAIDPSLHRAWTGSSNETILSNLEKVGRSGVSVTPRIPVVPSYTALPANLDRIAVHLEGRFPEVHLLSYHRWGESKKTLIDSPELPLDINPPSEEYMESARQIFERRGIVARIGG